jgi:release factor H-coupled RctB family protein
MNDAITLFTTPSSWIEGESIRQLERVASLPGMLKVAGFPDLHPGKGGPVGAAMLSEGMFYPYLVGSDVGCGMALFATELSAAKAKPEKWAKKLSGLEEEWDGDIPAWLQERGAVADRVWKWVTAGTIGMGNHFAELLKVKEVADPACFDSNKLHEDTLFLFVHSGSRGLGEKLLRSHVDVYRDGSLQAGSEEARHYLKEHDNCLVWAQASRELIAHRFLEQLGSGYRQVVDLSHNSITPIGSAGDARFLHRKGAAPSDQALVVIPGSRGACSYLVKPTGEQEANLRTPDIPEFAMIPIRKSAADLSPDRPFLCR